jgi:Tfp pilus assembly protein PilV
MLKLLINKRGLSLIEATIAVAVLSVGLLAIIQLFPTSLKMSRTAEQSTIAANLAQAKVEELFSLGYENINVGTIEAKHRLSSDPENPFYYYQRETITEHVNGNMSNSASATGMKKISVTVYWNSPHLSMERSLPVYALISQK